MKKKTVRIIVVIVIALIILIPLGIIGYIMMFLPNIPLKTVQVASTPDRLERGKYLAYHITVCMDCHSTRDWSKFSGPLTAGTEGKGGERFDQALGFPGVFYSPNITPYHLSDWSDAEVYRTITSGEAKDGRALFPIMPYLYYGSMDDEDIYSLIAFVRSLPPLASTTPAPKPDFPINIIMRTIPKPGIPGKLPPASDTVNYGKYLVNASGCIECHTPVNKGQIIKEKAFSGGREFEMPFGILRSANISQDKKTGIGSWTTQVFLNRFKAYDLTTYVPPAVTKNDFMTLMPWTMYAGMTTSDLVSVFRYLQTLPAMENKVEKTTFIK